MTRALDEYLELPYTISIAHDHDDNSNESFVAEVEEPRGCISQGETIEQAAAGVRHAMAGWLSVALEDGTEIPEPRGPDAYSGRFVLRLPKGLHAELARQAEREGVSLNQYVATALAGIAHWHSRDLVA